MTLISSSDFLEIADRLASQYGALKTLVAAISPDAQAASLQESAWVATGINLVARTPGIEGNLLTFAIDTSGGDDSPASLVVSGNDLTFFPQKVDGDIVSTYDDLVEAINDNVLEGDDPGDLVVASLDTGVVGSTLVGGYARQSFTGGTHGKYAPFIVATLNDDLIDATITDAAELDALAITDLYKGTSLWTNMLQALRNHLNLEGVANLIDGFLTTNDVRVHEYFDDAYNLSFASHLSAANVFKATSVQLGKITLTPTSTARITIRPRGAKATLLVNPTGDDNSVLYTAVTAGLSGCAINVTYIDPAAVSQTLYVEVLGKDIRVFLATDINGAITTTAANIIAAVNAHGVANDLVVASTSGADTGTVTAKAQAFLTNANTSLTFIAQDQGSEGANISITYVNPGSLTANTTCAVTNYAITITLAHSGTEITATAQDVKTAIESSDEAMALISVQANGTITGVVSAVAETFLEGGCGMSLTDKTPLGIGSDTASTTNKAAARVQVVVEPAVKTASLTVKSTMGRSTLVVDPGQAGNRRIRLTAVTPGVGGNDITIQFLYQQKPSLAEAVTIDGTDVLVRYSTNSASEITSTVGSIVASIIASDANDFVLAEAIDAGTMTIPYEQTPLSNSKNWITLTAKTAGAASEDITIELIDPETTTASTTSSTASGDIKVTLEHDGTNPVATGADVLAAIQADAGAMILVTAVAGSSTMTDLVGPYPETHLVGGSGPTTMRAMEIHLSLLRSDGETVIREVEIPEGQASGVWGYLGASKAVVTITPPSTSNSSVIFEAVTAGEAGNDFTITYVKPTLPSQALSVDWEDDANAIVNLATDVAGRVSTTASELVAAFNASDAGDFITATLSGEGYGYVAAHSETALVGGTENTERYFSITAAVEIAGPGGESGDVIKFNSVVERVITY